MRAKSFKLKYIPTEEQLRAAGFRYGGTWVDKSAILFKTFCFEFPKSTYETSVSICFPKNICDWNDFDHIIVLDEEFGQPYTPFYGDNYKKDITDFASLEYCIYEYNKFLGGFDFLEEVPEGEVV